MSDSSIPAPSTLLGTAPFGVAGHGYQLSDDLARLCLPQEFKDAYRRLAWVNSICFLFLVIGLVGLKAPKVIQKPLSEVQDTVPVVWVPPEQPPKPEAAKPDEPEPPQDTTLDTPQVVTVVAVADSANVAFPVPVPGAVAIAKEARFASPPPASQQVVSRPVRFNPNAATDGGTYPPPRYPADALRNRYAGTVTIELMVDPSGNVTSAQVQKTSGYPVLDQAALEVVKNRWRFPPGPPRYYYWPCIFQMQ